MSITVAREALGFMLTNSVRYCLGRQSYAPAWCRELVRAYADRVDDNFLRAIVRDIDEWAQGRTFYETAAGKARPIEDHEWAALADWLCATFPDCADERERERRLGPTPLEEYVRDIEADIREMEARG